MSRHNDPRILLAIGAAVGAFVVAVTSNILSNHSRKKLLMTRGRLKHNIRQSKQRVDSEEIDELTRLQTICKLIDVIERDIVPLTCTAACDGGVLNKLDGAAVLHSYNMSLLLATTNQEARCHLYHAVTLAVEEFCEILFSAKSAETKSSDYTIILTYKPCQKCYTVLSAANFGEIFYLFDTGNFPGAIDMTCCSSCKEVDEGKSDMLYCQSITTLIDEYGERRKKSRASGPISTDESGSNASSMTAKGMAIAAAADTLMVTMRRRIELLKLIYSRINKERLLASVS